MTHPSTLDFSKITTVIFDMDGTLIKHTWRLSQLTETLFARFAERLAPLTHDEFYDCFWPRNEDMWYMMVDGVLDGDTAARYSYANTLRALKKIPPWPRLWLTAGMNWCWTKPSPLKRRRRCWQRYAPNTRLVF
ncbi:MAG: hypothetical protein HC875_06080 [Anaerolineales bacterium]|nr:hypothetical protein [Anaerolineales bacterium]